MLPYSAMHIVSYMSCVCPVTVSAFAVSTDWGRTTFSTQTNWEVGTYWEHLFNKSSVHLFCLVWFTHMLHFNLHKSTAAKMHSRRVEHIAPMSPVGLKAPKYNGNEDTQECWVESRSLRLQSRSWIIAFNYGSLWWHMWNTSSSFHLHQPPFNQWKLCFSYTIFTFFRL